MRAALAAHAGRLDHISPLLPNPSSGVPANRNRRARAVVDDIVREAIRLECPDLNSPAAVAALELVGLELGR